jgi:hypothetical protein
LKHLFSTVVG